MTEELKNKLREKRNAVIDAAKFWQRHKATYGMEFSCLDDLVQAIYQLEEVEQEVLESIE